MPKPLQSPVQQYGVITGNYWAFTLTDGALRMLVVLYFYNLGYNALEVALLFVFYEFFGIVTNLLGGWLGAKIGLNKTMNLGLLIQIVALAMLLVPTADLSMLWVMGAQALSGIAKDLNKMSAKSAIKQLIPKAQTSQLFRWVALLTGSKNALKGVGFFGGGLLLSIFGFQGAIGCLLGLLFVTWCASLALLNAHLGQAQQKPKVKQLFSKSRVVNVLSLARFFLFGARDIWFVVALPVFLSTHWQWQHWQVGSLMAAWVIAYGLVQTLAPRIAGIDKRALSAKNTAVFWGAWVTMAPLLLTAMLITHTLNPWTLVAGLAIFGLLFAVNSSLHSFWIVHFARADGVSLDVGFYYMANAAGRLAGTVLSGLLFQTQGLTLCLLASSAFLLLSTLISIALPNHSPEA